MRIGNVIIKPVITEKSVKMAPQGKFTFIVAPKANKNQIRQAVQDLYGAEVGKVRTASKVSRKKRSWKSGKWVTHRVQKNEKKAIVEVLKGKDKLAKLFKF